MYTLPPLSYAPDALAPHIDARTMEIHHAKHHGAYVAKLNEATSGTAQADLELKTLMANITTETAPAIRNNGGGHYNHSLFWTLLTARPDGGTNEPHGELRTRMEQTFGSFANFQTQFAAAAMKRFGSGWAWLCSDASGALTIGSTPNQDNPLMALSPYKGKPLLGLDVWEHAYYLSYQNRRVDYIKAFWNIVNWEAVAANL